MFDEKREAKIMMRLSLEVSSVSRSCRIKLGREENLSATNTNLCKEINVELANDCKKKQEDYRYSTFCG